ncbi:MAG: membrane protein [Gordonia sp.]|nr:membrane protein [Gordonia sp. (in: high G+C Gram-positive bacteria)]
MGIRGPAAMPSLSRRSKALIATAVIVLVVLLVGPRFISIYTDWLWFDDIGYRSVFSKIIWTRVALFGICGVVAGLIIFGALWLAYRSRPVFVPTSGPGDPIARYRTLVMSRIRWFTIIPTVLVGLLAGLVAQGSWSTVQMFLHGESFGIKDPEFNLDVGFYAFDLPFYRFVLNFLFVVVVIAFIVSLVTHYIFGGIRLAGRGGTLTNAARIQLAVIAGTFLLLKAAAYWLDRYTLLSSTRKQEIFTGASYTDINAVLPSKLILMAIAVICAVAFFAGIILRDLRIPALATAMMLLSALVIGVGWPAAMEQFSVKPNAAEKEAEFIGRNIAATKQAYGITPDRVTYEDNWTAEPVNQQLVNADEPTLSNIRILDPNIISPAFTQVQRQQNFYGFPSQLALDRYEVDGQMRDFVVAARELDPSRFEANQQNWLNKHTVYTHGNGFIAAPANQVNEAVSNVDDVASGGGEPVFYVSDLRNYDSDDYKANAPIKVTQPRIYFGELISKVNPDYAIVGSDNGESREFDTPDSTYTYSGEAGVPLSNWFNKFAYAVKYTERNLLLSGAINKDSKIIYNRDPRDRVEKAAPWLTVDSKTYPAVMDDGSIKWIVDGYTTLDAFPYAQSTSLEDATTDAQQLNQGQTGRTQVNKQVSYVRNSVKATVDAYSGEVKLYQFDDKDPVLKTWMKVFPGSVEPRSEFDKLDDLKEHVRYPEDLFKIQRELLTKYHVDNPQTFFQGDAFWSVPSDPTDSAAVTQGLDQPPYYFVASDPETGRPSFQLTAVLNVLKQEFMASYLTVSSDPGNYGRITVKDLPAQPQREGPKQVFSAMETDGRVAESRKNLENTADVTFGNLLTLPVGDNGILNVVPMYAQAKSTAGTFPRLFRVIVRYNGKIGYAPTVADALALVGIDPSRVTQVPGAEGVPPTGSDPVPGQTEQQGQTTPPPSGNAPAVPASPQRDAIVERMNSALNAMEEALKSGNFTAYGQAQTDLQAAVQEYEALPTS